MKKLILSAAIAGICATGAANAAKVYEGNGLIYNLKGDWQIQLNKDVGDDQHLNVEFDDLEIKNNIVYDLGDGLKAFGQLDFGLKNAADKPDDNDEAAHLEEAYVGINFGDVAVSMGKRDFATYKFGIEQAYELKGAKDSFDEQGEDGDDVIRIDAKFNGITIALSHELESEGESSENGESTDLFIGTKLANIELAAAYQTMTASIGDDSVKTWGVSAAYDFGMAKILADYSDIEERSKQYNVAAVVPVTKSAKVALGLNTLDPDTSGAETVQEWYANITYKFPAQKNVSLFAEIGDTDEDDVDMGYLAGLRIKF